MPSARFKQPYATILPGNYFTLKIGGPPAPCNIVLAAMQDSNRTLLMAFLLFIALLTPVLSLADGWNLGSSYQITDWFHLAGYYSESYNNTVDRESTSVSRPGNDIPHRSYFKDACLTTNFIVNEYWNIKLEGRRFIGTQRISAPDQVPDDNGKVFTHKDWSLFAAGVTFSF